MDAGIGVSVGVVCVCTLAWSWGGLRDATDCKDRVDGVFAAMDVTEG